MTGPSHRRSGFNAATGLRRRWPALVEALWVSVLLASTAASGALAGTADARLNIAQVFFAQHHVFAPDNPLFALVGNLEALIKVQVYSQTAHSSPQVCAKLALGSKVLELPLKGPALLPKPPTGNPILMEQRYEDSFTAIIPRQWIKPGLKVRVELRERKDSGYGLLLDSKTFDTLPIGAPTRLILTMFDFHFFGGAKGADYPKGWFEELGSKLPVAELELRRVRNIMFDKLVMPPRANAPAVLCSSRAEYQKKAGVSFDGEQDVAGRWNAALKQAAGAGWGGTRRLYYSNIYGVHSGGQGGGLSGRGNGTSPGILLHELGHAFGLPHWGGKKQYPYVGPMYGIAAPGNSDASPHVGPTWAFDLARRAFISPIKEGHYKHDPMQGGGSGDRQPYLYTQFSDYSLSRIRHCLEATQLVWDESAGGYAQWDPNSGAYSNIVRRRGPPPCPIEDDVEVISVLACASRVTAEANIVYPPIGPYVAGRLETFDATSPLGISQARGAGYNESNCNLCLRVTQGGKVRTYLLKDGLSPQDDPKASNSLCVIAVNLPARDGQITEAELLDTPGVMSRGVSPNCKVLASWKADDSPAYKTETVTAVYPAEAAPKTDEASLKSSAQLAANQPPMPQGLDEKNLSRRLRPALDGLFRRRYRAVVQLLDRLEQVNRQQQAKPNADHDALQAERKDIQAIRAFVDEQVTAALDRIKAYVSADNLYRANQLVGEYNRFYRGIERYDTPIAKLQQALRKEPYATTIRQGAQFYQLLANAQRVRNERTIGALQRFAENVGDCPYGKAANAAVAALKKDARADLDGDALVAGAGR